MQPSVALKGIPQNKIREAEEAIQEAVKAIRILRSQGKVGSKILGQLSSGKTGKYPMWVLYEAFLLEGYEVEVYHHDSRCEAENCNKDKLVISERPMQVTANNVTQFRGPNQGKQSGVTLDVSSLPPGRLPHRQQKSQFHGLRQAR